MSERLDKIKEMLDEVTAFYKKFGKGGSLCHDRFKEIIPLSVSKEDEHIKFLSMTTGGLEGLMKILTYSDYVERRLKNDITELQN